MTKDRNSRKTSPKYARIHISEIRKTRRGKHHDLLKGILDDMESLPSGSAIKIPFAEVEGVALANLRSAVHRASAASGIAIETVSDQENFYIWKTK